MKKNWPATAWRKVVAAGGMRTLICIAVLAETINLASAALALGQTLRPAAGITNERDGIECRRCVFTWLLSRRLRGQAVRERGL